MSKDWTVIFSKYQKSAEYCNHTFLKLDTDSNYYQNLQLVTTSENS